MGGQTDLLCCTSCLGAERPHGQSCQNRWFLTLLQPLATSAALGIVPTFFLLKRGKPHVWKSHLQVNISAWSLSHMLWLDLEHLADLKASQEGCERPCPALLRLCRAGTFTPHLTLAAEVPPMRLEVTVTQIPPWEPEQEPSPDGHPGLQTDTQVSRQEKLFLGRPSSLPSNSPVAELMRFSTSVPQRRA